MITCPQAWRIGCFFLLGNFHPILSSCLEIKAFSRKSCYQMIKKQKVPTLYLRKCFFFSSLTCYTKSLLPNFLFMSIVLKAFFISWLFRLQIIGFNRGVGTLYTTDTILFIFKEVLAVGLKYMKIPVPQHNERTTRWETQVEKAWVEEVFRTAMTI